MSGVVVVQRARIGKITDHDGVLLCSQHPEDVCCACIFDVMERRMDTRTHSGKPILPTQGVIVPLVPSHKRNFDSTIALVDLEYKVGQPWATPYLSLTDWKYPNMLGLPVIGSAKTLTVELSPWMPSAGRADLRYEIMNLVYTHQWRDNAGSLGCESGLHNAQIFNGERHIKSFADTLSMYRTGKCAHCVLLEREVVPEV